MAITLVILVGFDFLSPYGMFKLPQFKVNKQSNASMKQLTIGKNTISVEIADTPTERQTGLMNRKSMDKNSGMLFIFEQDGVYPFWMKNTLIPLDMIWINSV
jgi:uncharacterized membrane protein (UPF0127 family)